VRVLGVDLAGTRRGGSDVCVVSDGSARRSGRVGSDQELLAWLAPLVGEDALVAIDAP
jgi:predicted RNase H-like nuclease